MIRPRCTSAILLPVSSIQSSDCTKAGLERNVLRVCECWQQSRCSWSCMPTRIWYSCSGKCLLQLCGIIQWVPLCGIQWNITMRWSNNKTEPPQKWSFTLWIIRQSGDKGQYVGDKLWVLFSVFIAFVIIASIMSYFQLAAMHYLCFRTVDQYSLHCTRTVGNNYFLKHTHSHCDVLWSTQRIIPSDFIWSSHQWS